MIVFTPDPNVFNSTGCWYVRDGTQLGKKTMSISVAIHQEGEALRCEWSPGEAPSKASHLGYGMATTRGLVASRSLSSGTSSEDFTTAAGIVVYDVSKLGRLPARWYHPDLNGRIGNGLSVDGPKTGLCGTYRAEYSSGTEDFEPLVKELSCENGVYRFRWLKSGSLIYVGVGMLVEGHLIAGWSTPRSCLEVLSFHADDSGQRMDGQCGRLATLTSGHEGMARTPND